MASAAEQMAANLSWKTLGKATADETELQATWLSMQTELARLTALLPFLHEISRVTASIDAVGASNWAKRLRTQAASTDADKAEFAKKRIAEITADSGLTPRQFAVLQTVEENDGISQTALSVRTGIDRSTLAELAARLIAQVL